MQKRIFANTKMKIYNTTVGKHKSFTVNLPIRYHNLYAKKYKITGISYYLFSLPHLDNRIEEKSP